MSTRTAEEMVQTVLREAPGPGYVREVARGLLQGLTPLERILEVWDLSQSRCATLFGVSRQAFTKWLHDGVPAERYDQVLALSVATDDLVAHLKPERVRAVVRRRAPAFGGRSLLDLAADGDMRVVVERVREMFDLGRVQP